MSAVQALLNSRYQCADDYYKPDTEDIRVIISNTPLPDEAFEKKPEPEPEPIIIEPPKKKKPQKDVLAELRKAQGLDSNPNSGPKRGVGPIQPVIPFSNTNPLMMAPEDEVQGEDTD